MLSLFGARLLSESFWDARLAVSGKARLGLVLNHFGARAMAAAASSAQSCARREGQGPRAMPGLDTAVAPTLAGSADEPYSLRPVRY